MMIFGTMKRWKKMNQNFEEKLIIDYNEKAIKGYCKAKDFKEQFKRLKEVI